MHALDSRVRERLKETLGPDGASEDAAALAPHLSEWRGRWKGNSPLLLKPRSTEEVARILAICDETRTPIVAQGGNTGLVGGQIPTNGEVLLSLERMNRIRQVSAEENLLTAEAGVVLANAQNAALAAGRLFPLSLAAEGSCTIGGNISTNAGGVNVLRYGMMRDLVMGLEVVLAGGRVLDLMRGLRKDNTGYDLKQLFIGAEGTLGVVTAAVLKLFPKPAGFTTALAGIAGPQEAVELLNRIQKATGGQVTAFELMERRALELVAKHIPGTVNPLLPAPEWSVLIELSNPAAYDMTAALEDALASAIGDRLVSDAVFAKSERERKAIWRLRETIPEAQRLDSPSIANDVTLPLSRIGEFLALAEIAIKAAFPAARSFTFGHVGDGNLHYAIQAPGDEAGLIPARPAVERAVWDSVAQCNGSISAEHGLGLAKNSCIADYKSTAEIEIMRMLKRTLDPNNILNPGKLLPPV